MARQSKGTPRSKAWFDGFNGTDPTDSSDSYAADYREGQAERIIRHERLDRVCADARRTDAAQKEREAELRQRGIEASFMGESRKMVASAGLV